MAKIFLSYSSIEQHIAERVHAALESYGHEVWMDRADLRGGDPWIDVIQDHIRWCEIMVVLWSEHAAESQWVKDELTYARSHRKQIVPMQLDNIDPTRSLIINALQMIDARGDRLETAIKQVDEVIQRGPGWMPQRATRSGWLSWAVIGALLAAVVLVIGLVLPQLNSDPPGDTITLSPRPTETPSATPEPVVEPASVATLNNWRQQQGLPPLGSNPLLDQVAQTHVRYVRSLPLQQLDQTNVYRDRDGNGAQWMVNEAGYNGSVQMFVEVAEGGRWTLTEMLEKLDLEGGANIHTRYDAIGFAGVESLATANRYYVVILGRETD